MQIIKTDGMCLECKKIFTDGYEIAFCKRTINKQKLCSCCANKLYSKLASAFVPKSPKNIINSKTKKQESMQSKIKALI